MAHSHADFYAHDVIVKTMPNPKPGKDAEIQIYVGRIHLAMTTTEAQALAADLTKAIRLAQRYPA